jgi:hypothetical protein
VSEKTLDDLVEGNRLATLQLQQLRSTVERLADRMRGKILTPADLEFWRGREALTQKQLNELHTRVKNMKRVAEGYKQQRDHNENHLDKAKKVLALVRDGKVDSKGLAQAYLSLYGTAKPRHTTVAPPSPLKALDIKE